MKIFWTFFICLVCFSAVVFGQSSVCQSLAVPAYFYPGQTWTTARNSAPKLKLMVMNPNSGSGTSANSDYVAAVANARAAGIKVVGYVYTNYGARSAAVVKQEITNYKNWYTTDGIFFDEAATANTPALLNYYQDLANFTRQTANQKVILNPGTMPDEAYMSVADVIVTFEGKFKNYAAMQTPAWVANYQPNRFWHIVYGANIWQTLQVLKLAEARNAGYVYITEDQFANPYDTLPRYLSKILERLPTNCVNN